MNVFFLPSWYRHRCHPLHGTFVIEQAMAIGELHPDGNVAISLWGQGEGRVSFAHYLGSPMCLVDALRGPWSAETPRRENVVDFMTRTFSWNEDVLGGNRAGLLRANVRNLRRAERRFGRIDLLHAHVSYPGGWVAMRLSERTGIPYVVTEHMGPFPIRVYENPDGSPKDYVREPLERAHARIGVSPALCDRIASFGIPRPEYVPNVIDERKYALTVHPPGKPFEFFTLGGMEPVKGFDDLVRAIAVFLPMLSAAERERVAFRLGGYGPFLETYQKLARDLGVDRWISWLGFLPRERAREEFHRCDAYVLSSRHESFGVTLLETMATGKPVIATRCGGPESIVRPENGLLVDVGRADQMASAMHALFTRSVPFDGERIRNAVLAEFSRPAVVGKLEAIYRRVLDAAPAREPSPPRASAR